MATGSDFRPTFDGISNMPVDFAARLIVPSYNDCCILHANGANGLAYVDPPEDFRNCRYIKADVGGICRIRYVNDKGGHCEETLVLVTATLMPVRNVVRLWRYYIGSTAGTCEVYNSNGGLIVNAIKLLR